jgi:hypothetical protein
VVGRLRESRKCHDILAVQCIPHVEEL